MDGLRPLFPIAAFAASIVAGILIHNNPKDCPKSAQRQQYSIPDQPARFAAAKKSQNQRVLDIDSEYNRLLLKGKVALVTGGNRGR
jgi:hypothetical protein